MASIAMAVGMRVDDLDRIPFSFPTYTGVFVRAAHNATCKLREYGAAPPELLDWAS
jgi:hypothetical protein